MEYYKNLDLADIKYFCEIDLVWKTEEWKDLTDYEGIYQVSDLGRIKSLSRGKINGGSKVFIITKTIILKPSFDNAGYLHVNIFSKIKKRTVKVHKLVAIAFLGHVPCGMLLVINHKNFIKSDNRKVNLEIVTSRENSNLLHKKSVSKYVGVTLKENGKWRARIVIDRKRKHLGYFHSELAAHQAYQDELKKINSKK